MFFNITPFGHPNKNFSLANKKDRRAPASNHPKQILIKKCSYIREHIPVSLS